MPTPDPHQPQRPEEAAALAAAAQGAQQMIQPARFEFTAFEALNVELDGERNRRIVALSAMPKLVIVIALPPENATKLGEALIAPSVTLPGGQPPAPNGGGPQ